ncbi:hypothetical protein [Actinophytocola sp.]|uniref:hypothetical protein n=1 Tax=Actinophytocola sp. TaxID=1872138 RepID=UPI002ED015E5
MIRKLVVDITAATIAAAAALTVFAGMADGITGQHDTTAPVAAASESDPWDTPKPSSDPWDAPTPNSDPWDAPQPNSDPWD